MIKTIQNTIFQQSLFAKGAKIVVGVSGGADSSCLLNVLLKLQKKYDLQLIVAHINYGLRGKNSDGDEKFVRELAEKNDLKIEVLKIKELKNISENKLRNMRYEFFEKICVENKFDWIAVAHNSDDQVETFLMRIIRGAGLQGLSAMKYKNGKIIRPLLNISRKEILEYLKKNKLSYRIDKTNKQNVFFRNKIRNKLVPYLKKNFNPKISETIFAATQSIAEDMDLLQQLTTVSAKGNKISAKDISRLHPALQKRVLLAEIAKNKGNNKNIEACHIEEILRALRSVKNKNQTVCFQGLKMTRKGDKITFSKP